MSSKTIAVVNYDPHFAEDFFYGVRYVSSRVGHSLNIRAINSAEQIDPTTVDLIVIEPWRMPKESLEKLLVREDIPRILVVTSQDKNAFSPQMNERLEPLDPIYLPELAGNAYRYLSGKFLSL